MSKTFFRIIIWAGVLLLLVFPPIARGAVDYRSQMFILIIESLLIFLWLWKALQSEDFTSDIPESNKRKIFFRKTHLDKPIVFFLCLAVISLFFSIYRLASIHSLFMLFGYTGIFYLIINEFNLNLRKRLLLSIVSIGTGLSFYGILQYIGILEHPWWGLPHCLSATYVNHNHFSGYLEMVIPIAVAFYIGQGSWAMGQKKKNKAVIGLALLIMITAFVLAQSRGGWISLTFSLFIMNIILIKGNFLSKKSILFFIMFIILVFALAYIHEGNVAKRIETMTEGIENEASLTTRIFTWKGTIDMIRDNPVIGTGIGTFVWGFAKYRPEELHSRRFYYAYNDYLHIAAEMGILAPLILLWGLITAWVYVFRSKNRNNISLEGTLPIFERLIKIGCATGLLSLACHSLIDFNFHIPANMLVATAITAVLISRKVS